MGVASGQMNSSWAALAGEAVVSDCGEIAGHVDGHLVTLIYTELSFVAQDYHTLPHITL